VTLTYNQTLEELYTELAALAQISPLFRQARIPYALHHSHSEGFASVPRWLGHMQHLTTEMGIRLSC
jgi:hypothetical protein